MKKGDKVKLKDSESYLKEMNKGVHPGVHYEVIQITQDDGIKLDGISNYVCASNFVKVKLEKFKYDFLGKKISINDEVVYVRQGYRDFSKAFVKRFTDQFVILQTNKFSNSGEFKQRPDQLIKIS